MPKIGITGTHGGGKSTLAGLLAGAINHDLIVEKVYSTAIALGYKGPSFIPPEAMALFQWEVLVAQAEAEGRMNDFITDRTFLDFAAYWILNTGVFTGPEWGNYTALCARRARAYDIIFYVPPNSKGCEENGKRFTHGVTIIDEVIRRYIREWGLDEKVVKLTSDDPQARLAEVMAALDLRGLIRR